MTKRVLSLVAGAFALVSLSGAGIAQDGSQLSAADAAKTRSMLQVATGVITLGRTNKDPMMMVVGTRAMLPLALMVGVYIFLRGHNEPGGGFIAGLVVAIALLMQYMASGFAWAQERARVDYHAMIATGVLAAGLTGIAAWFFGWPFLKSTYTYLHVPLIGEVEVASAMGFDLGVFLCVVGSVMLALANLSRIGRIAEHLEVPEGPMDVDPSKLIDPAVVPAAN